MGGGTVRAVSFDEVVWADSPDRDDAGSPNVVGVVAPTAAADELARGWGARIAHEAALVRALDDALATVPGLHRLGSVSADRLPVAAFVIDGVPHGLVAARLAHEHGIGVRAGQFCAHPLVRRLTGAAQAGACGDGTTGLLRVSFGLGTTTDDTDRLVAGLAEVLRT